MSNLATRIYVKWSNLIINTYHLTGLYHKGKIIGAIDMFYQKDERKKH